MFEDVVLSLQSNSIGAFPCDTVWGLIGPVTDEAALALAQLKNRSLEKGFIVLIPDLESLFSWVTVSESQLALLTQIWPGPVTVILPKKEGVSDLITGGRSTLAIRFPGDGIICDLLKAYGKPLLSTSLNRSDEAPLDSLTYLSPEFRSQLSFCYEGQPALGLVSTLVDLTTRPYRVLREGAFDMGPYV